MTNNLFRSIQISIVPYMAVVSGEYNVRVLSLSEVVEVVSIKYTDASCSSSQLWSSVYTSSCCATTEVQERTYNALML